MLADRCPFCGSTTVGVFAGRQAKYVVTCLAPVCGATGPEGTTPAEAVGRWRTRHTVSAPAPPIAEQLTATPLWTGGTLTGPLGSVTEKQALIDTSLASFRARRERA